jgi:hypothetical protein
VHIHVSIDGRHTLLSWSSAHHISPCMLIVFSSSIHVCSVCSTCTYLCYVGKVVSMNQNITRIPDPLFYIKKPARPDAERVTHSCLFGPACNTGPRGAVRPDGRTPVSHHFRISFHKPNKKVRSEKKIDYLISETKYTLY